MFRHKDVGLQVVMCVEYIHGDLNITPGEIMKKC